MSTNLPPVGGAPDVTGCTRGQGAGPHVARLLGAVTPSDGGNLAQWASSSGWTPLCSHHLRIDPVEDVDPVAGHPASLHPMTAGV